MKFHSAYALDALKDSHRKRLAVRSLWGLLASIGIIGALVMAMPL